MAGNGHAWPIPSDFDADYLSESDKMDQKQVFGAGMWHGR
jgi:hypothetical protein